MSKTERVYKIEALIRARGHVRFQDLMDTLEVSRATLKRDLEFLRDRMGAPIEYDRDLNGYRFAAAGRGQPHELPGLWFSERELYALLMAHQLLAGLDDEGILSRHLQPLLERIHQILGGSGEDDARALMKRVKIFGAARRPVDATVFEVMGEALMKRKRIGMRYLTRGRGAVTQRTVSPQRLVHYRNTWYLDAWCHTKDALLRFALDAVERAELVDQRARDVAMKQVEAGMDAGYGIYAGGTPRWARLEFSAQAAPWVSREQWHPDAQGTALADGRWALRLPYVNETELVMDLLRHGEQVRVLEPASLRQAVHKRLKAAVSLYDAG